MLSEAQLRQDLQTSMRARDALTTSVLRGILAVVGNLKIEKGVSELPSGDIATVVLRETKKREEAEEYARQAGRDDLVAQNTAERAVLERYRPRPLDDAELTNLIRSWVAEGMNSLGPIMARLKEHYPGQYDGKRAAEIAKHIVSES